MQHGTRTRRKGWVRPAAALVRPNPGAGAAFAPAARPRS
jgi:hypothetical protein